MSEKIVIAKLSQIRESSSNPRKIFGDLAEMAASIKSQGVLQPPLAREVVGGGYELVFGHRRFRAAKLAGLKEMPLHIRVMSDVEVLEAQLTENLARQDIHPLELAGGYQALMEKGFTAEQVAARLGISRTSVFNSLRLLKLTDEPRREFLSNKLPMHSALAISKMETERLQLSALKAITSASKDGPLPARAVEKLIKRRFGDENRHARTQKRDDIDGNGGGLIANRATKLLLSRVNDVVGRRPQLEDTDLRLMLLALKELSPEIQELLVERRATERNLSNVRGAQLRALFVEAVLTPWVKPGTDAEKATSKTYGFNLGELTKTAKALVEADGVFDSGNRIRARLPGSADPAARTLE